MTVITLKYTESTNTWSYTIHVDGTLIGESSGFVSASTAVEDAEKEIKVFQEEEYSDV